MSLKTSFFSSAIFKADAKRFWWTSLVETLLIMLVCILPIYETCQNTFGDITLKWYGATSLPLIFGCAIPVLIFSYLHTAPPATTLHSYPITRGSLFATKVTTSVILTLAPVVINAAILALMAFTPACVGNYSLWDVVQWLMPGISYTLIILSLTIVVNMMTGNSLASIIFTLGFTLIPLIFSAIFTDIFSKEIVGFSTRNMPDWLTYIYIDAEGLKGLLYVLYSLVLLGGAYLLYRIRKIESNGEIVAFGWLKPVFIGIVAAIASGLSYLYFNAIFNWESIFSLMPLGIAGAAIAHMVSVKALDFKGALKPAGIYIICALCFIGVIEFDIVGFEKRVPDIDRVKSVSLDIPLYDFNFYDNELVINEKENIEAVIKLHRELSRKAKLHRSGSTIYICYNLKNGSRLKREYNINPESYRELLAPIYESSEFINGTYELINTKDKTYTNITISDRRLEKDIDIFPNEEIAKEIIAAIREDIKHITFYDLTRPETICTVEIDWNEYYDGSSFIRSESYSITPRYINTLEVLKKVENLHIPTAEDIWEIQIDISELQNQGGRNSGTDVFLKENFYSDFTVHNPETIEEIYEQYYSMVSGYHFDNYENAVHIDILCKLTGDYEFHVSCYYDRDKVPEVFQKLIDNQKHTEK